MSQAAPAQTSTPSPDTAPPTSVRWHIVGLLIAFSFMTWFNRVSMSVAYDEQIKEQTGIAPEDIGFVYSSFLFAYMVFMTPGGWLIDRYGAWAALAVMGVGSALYGALTGAAGLLAFDVLASLLLIRSFMGVLTAPVYPACGRIVAQWMPVAQRAFANGLIQGAAAVGIACCFPVFGLLLDAVGWQIAFVITGTVTLLIALAWIAYATNEPAQHRLVNAAERRWIDVAHSSGTAPPAGAWWLLLRHRSLMLLTCAYAAVGYVEYLFFFWMHYYFEDILKLGKGESRLYAAVLMLALAAGMVLGGWLHDRLQVRFGPRSTAVVPVLGLALGAACLILGVLSTSTAMIVIWLSIAIAAVGATEAPTWTTAIALGGPQGGTAAAICNTGGNAGGLIAPIITPIVGGWISRQHQLSEQAGWQWSIALGSLIAVLGAALWYGVTPDKTASSIAADVGRVPPSSRSDG